MTQAKLPNTKFLRARKSPLKIAGLIMVAMIPIGAQGETNTEDPYRFFLLEPLPKTIQQAQDYNGWVNLGLGVINSDNQQFGRYNGLYEEGWYLDLDLEYLSWLHTDGGTTYIGFEGDDLGLDTRSASIYMGRLYDHRFEFGYRQQYQYNGSAQTPFLGAGGSSLVLPSDWVAAGNTSDMSGLDQLNGYRLDRERETLYLSFKKRFSEMWSFDSRFQHQEKGGTDVLGVAHYLDGSNGHASLLPAPIDYNEQQLDLSAHLKGEASNLELRYHYSRFENDKDYLVWQNPYQAGFGVDVDYPNGLGLVSQAPDNDVHQFRLIGQHGFNEKVRGQLDASYSIAAQNDDFFPYSANTALVVDEDLPRNSLDGEVVTSTLNGHLFYQWNNRLNLRAKYQYEDRDNQSPRDGYRYIRGDSANQPEEKFTVYNRPTSRTRNLFGLEANYRFANRARMLAEYEYEEVARYNAAVEKTKEDRINVSVRARSNNGTGARFSMSYGDRRASTYLWDQSYYALLDAQLINETPQTQRFTNHPLLSQYHLASRDRVQAKMNLSMGSAKRWQHNLDIAWDYDDYDHTDLGLENAQYTNLTLSSTYLGDEEWVLTGYYALGLNQYTQRGRAFLGGIEKNPFVTIPPYPQASDPERDWRSSAEDWSHAFGINSQWVVVKDVFHCELDFQFVDTVAEQTFASFGADDLAAVDLPDNTSRLHHLTFTTHYQINKDVSTAFQYQYYRYAVSDWAVDDLEIDGVNKVLWSGESAANDIINAFALSVRYHLP